MKASFIINNPKSEFFDIHIRVNHDYKQKQRSTGVSLPSDNWDLKKGWVKGHSNEVIKARNKLLEMKDLLLSYTDLEEAFVEFDRVYKSVKVLPKDKLVGLADYIDKAAEMIDGSKSTINKYKRSARNIRFFCEAKNLSDDLNKMNRDEQLIFFTDYVKFLANEEYYVKDKLEKAMYQNVSIKDDIKKIGATCSRFESIPLKIKLSDIIKNYKVADQKAVYCTPEEIDRLMVAECFTTIEEEIRDCCIFQAFTGLRHNELYSVTESNVSILMVNGNKIPVLSHVQNKSKKRNNVPLNSICMGIIDKYKKRNFKAPKMKVKGEWQFFVECLLPVHSNQQSNKTLHKLCRAIGMQQIITEVKYSGNEKIVTNTPKYKLVSTHSMRHSYAYRMKEAGKPDGMVAELMGIDEATYIANYRHAFGVSSILDAYEALEVKVLPKTQVSQ